MLIIYSAFAVGGIETFFVRLARARQQRGLVTRFLLTGRRSDNNEQLLAAARECADVHFLEDHVRLPASVFRRLPRHLLLALPLRVRSLAPLFDGIEQVHVPSSIFGFLYLKLAQRLGLTATLTVGVYHSREFIWRGVGEDAFFERQNRQLFFDCLDPTNLVFFNERLVEQYESFAGRALNTANVFPLGVVEESGRTREPNVSRPLTIGSVGRLVPFKSYNLWMLDVIADLRRRGIDACYLVYGTGPLEATMRARIAELQLGEYVSLKGELPYAELKPTLTGLDLFVGSGTAIVEAANQGVPSIVGVESISEPVSYGFFADIPGFTYNEQGMYPYVDVTRLIADFAHLQAAQRVELGERHIAKAQMFSMQQAVDNFTGIAGRPLADEVLRSKSGAWFGLHYSLSFLMFSLRHRLVGNNAADAVYG